MMGFALEREGDIKMLLKKGTFESLSTDVIRNNAKIIIFGTGVIGRTVVPEILSKYDILYRVICCIDNDVTKSGETIYLHEKGVSVYAPDILKSINDYTVVLISMSRFHDAYEQLVEMNLSDNVSCYIFPAMCIDCFHSKGNKGVIKTSDHPIIPKKIHYMWFGKKEIPETLEKCIDSWKTFCPGYDIIRWDESNYDVKKNRFVAQAYENKKYGFVPDYARIELLYEYGGIYLDTDVELIRNIDDLLYQEAFCGVEKWQVLNFGGLSGAVKGHASLEPFLERWGKRELFRRDGSLDNTSSGMIDTEVALRQGYLINGLNQTINGMNIYTYDYFHPYDYMSGYLEMTNDTFSIHHFNGGWLDSGTDTVRRNTMRQYSHIMNEAIMI